MSRTHTVTLVASKFPLALSGDHDLNDLFALDLDRLEWTNLTAIAVGHPPAPRSGLGFASNSGRLFVYGGTRLLEEGIEMR